MEIGYFTMPSHPPECGLKEGHDWDLQVLRWLDELGYQEAWIGEHHTAPWEPHPAPDLLIAQALLQTKNIRIGPGGFLLPYHHPAELANRVAMLDHLSGGRLNFGVAASGLPSDWAMFHVDGNTGQHREMTREALNDDLLKLWREDSLTVIFVTHSVFESTYLSTRVVVMTPHPGTVKVEVPISLPRPRDPLSVEFLDHQKELLRLLGQDARGH